MKIDKLHEMYLELKAKYDGDEKPEKDFVDALYEMYDQNIELKVIPSSEKMAVIRTVLNGCKKNIGLYEYVDEALAKITFDIIMIPRMTDIELDNSDDENDDRPSSLKYDSAYLMGLREYLWHSFYEEMREFEEFRAREEETIRKMNEPGAILEKQRLLKEGKLDENEKPVEEKEEKKDEHI